MRVLRNANSLFNCAGVSIFGVQFGIFVILELIFCFVSARTDRAWHRLVLPDCNTSANRNHAFRHPFDCSKYFTCDKSGVVENVCDEGLSFNQNSESCMPESNCETMKPIFSSGRKSQPELEQVRRRHNVQNDCDNKVDEFDETVEKSPTPSVRKHAYFYDDDYDENNEEDVDNLESYEK